MFARVNEAFYCDQLEEMCAVLVGVVTGGVFGP